VQSDQLDQGRDLWLGAAEQQRAAVGAEPARDHRQIDHQRGIREHELGQIDDDIRLRPERSGQCRPAAALRRSILIASDAQRGRLFIEIDDPANLPKAAGAVQGIWTLSPKLQLMVSVDEVMDALREVIDPELGLDFVELGLIYDVTVEGGTVQVTYTLTSPGCPIGPQVAEQIDEFVSELDGVDDVQTEMTFSPPWTPELMSEDAKFALGF
jgi:metal-sulfur cluster biosynthetic enzyme